VVGRKGTIFAIARLEQAVLLQLLRADKERIGHERRQRLIGRMAVTRWPERQHLPPGLTCGGESIHPGKRGRPHVPDPVAGRQRRHVQEDPGSAVSGPEGSSESARAGSVTARSLGRVLFTVLVSAHVDAQARSSPAPQGSHCSLHDSYGRSVVSAELRRQGRGNGRRGRGLTSRP